MGLSTEIRNIPHDYGAIAPRLASNPRYGVVDIGSFLILNYYTSSYSDDQGKLYLNTPEKKISFRMACPTSVDVDDSIASPSPVSRIGSLHLVLVDGRLK